MDGDFVFLQPCYFIVIIIIFIIIIIIIIIWSWNTLI